MPSISKKYSRKRNNRKRGHSRRRMRRKSRHASYYRRRRNMFGGKGGYQVNAFYAGNASNQANSKALDKLRELEYLDYKDGNYVTNEKFTSNILDELLNTFKLIKLPDTDISLQQNRYDQGATVVEVKYTKGDALIGMVTFR